MRNTVTRWQPLEKWFENTSSSQLS
jgi:hypothetical protein